MYLKNRKLQNKKNYKSWEYFTFKYLAKVKKTSTKVLLGGIKILNI